MAKVGRPRKNPEGGAVADTSSGEVISRVAFSHRKEAFAKMIEAHAGVLYLEGKAGIGKSAMFAEIANEQGWALIDCRLAMMDEADIGGIPEKKVDPVSKRSYFEYALPEWVIEACKRPTLVLFDELNRATLPKRNAALQILLNRKIGMFSFPDTVYFAAAGNMGEADGCDVEEMDNALLNRLVTVNFQMTAPEWIEGYAQKNVITEIVEFIKAHGMYLYKDPVEGEKAFATPRSWTFLSDAIKHIYGAVPKVSEYISFVKEYGSHYIGVTVKTFLRFLEERMQLSVKDILDRYDEVAELLKTIDRSRKSELLTEIRNINIDDVNQEQRENLHKFMKIIDEDELVAAISDMIRKCGEGLEKKENKEFFKKYHDIIVKIKKIMDDEDKAVSKKES